MMKIKLETVECDNSISGKHCIHWCKDNKPCCLCDAPTSK